MSVQVASWARWRVINLCRALTQWPTVSLWPFPAA